MYNVCERTIATNHRTMQCQTCKFHYHIKCAGISVDNHLQLQLRCSCWTCTTCLLDAPPRDLSFNSTIDFSQEQNDSTHSIGSEEDPLCIMSNMRQTHHNQDLLVHLNINSIQNKFDELKEINKALRARLLILTKTKIDCSYPNNQFKLIGYHMYRNDRAKGGGGVIAYVKTGIAVKRLKLPNDYKTK